MEYHLDVWFSDIEDIIKIKQKLNEIVAEWKANPESKTLIEVFAEEEKKKGQAQDTDPHAPHYFAPYDDQGNKRTINNAVDAGWSAID